jgi:propionate catabolism operon transcriptional regulator
MERLALFLAAEPLQALTPGFIARITPEIVSRPDADPTVPTLATSSAAEHSLTALMEKFNNNREKVAQYLGISRTTLWRRLAQEKHNSTIS